MTWKSLESTNVPSISKKTALSIPAPARACPQKNFRPSPTDFPGLRQPTSEPADQSPLTLRPKKNERGTYTQGRQLNPPLPAAPAQMDALREQIRRIEAGDRVPRGVLPFGVPDLDDRLPSGGRALGG